MDWQHLLSRVQADFRAGRLAEAEAGIEPALAQASVPADAWNLAALIRLKRRHAENALKAAKRASAASPRSAGFLNTMGLVCEALKDWSAAARAYRRAAELQPDAAPLHYNLGNALLNQNKLELALAAFRAAVKADAGLASAWNNAAHCLKYLGRHDEALTYFQQALTIRPDYPQALYNVGLLHLAAGRFDQGWPFYEYRWAAEGNSPPQRNEPRWDGRMLAGETVLLWSEQGFGDCVQFIRFAKCVAARGGRVVVESFAEMTSLLSRVEGVSAVYPQGQVDEPIHWQLPIASLPGVFHWRPEDSINAAPYVSPPANGPHLPPGEGLKVGVVWGGRRLPDPHRTCPMAAFRTLFSVPGVTFHSFQMGEWRDDLKRLPAKGAPMDLAPFIQSFDDTAALMAQLDLMITIDSGPAHLAAALGVPTWLLVPEIADWRWLAEGDTNPWYPSMRIFRQQRLDEWQPLIKAVATKLQALSADTDPIARLHRSHQRQ